MNKSDKTSLAKYISNIFHPFILAFITAVLITLHSTDYNYQSSAISIFIILIFLVVIPVIILYVLKSYKITDDFDLSDRSQRHKFYPVGLILIIFTIIALKIANAPQDLFRLISALIIVFGLNYLINRKIKISIHTTIAVGSATILYLFFGLFPGLVGLIISAMVIWSRIILKKHTWIEVITASLIAVIVNWVVFILTQTSGI